MKPHWKSNKQWEFEYYAVYERDEQKKKEIKLQDICHQMNNIKEKQNIHRKKSELFLETENMI